MLIPFAAIGVVIRRWRYALLTVPTLLITCSFAVVYDNAEITRYYLGPLLIVVTWLALLADGVRGARRRLSPAQLRGALLRPARAAIPRRPALELAVAVALVVPAGLAAPTTRLEVDESRDMVAADWIDRMFTALPAEHGGHQLVELLDSAMVRTRCRRSTTRHRDHRRSDDPRREPRRGDGRDRPVPRQASRLRHPIGSRHGHTREAL